MSERVLIYGSRDWSDSNAIRDVVLALHRDDVVIHGGAGGADTLAGKWAKACGLRVEVYRADWKNHRDCHCDNLRGNCRFAGPRRNQRMIDQGHPTKAYGFRRPGVSRGTDDMTNRLAKAGIPHKVLRPAPSSAPTGGGREGTHCHG